MRQERVSPRQAVIVMPSTADPIGDAVALPPAERFALRRAALLDVFGALARVDGATLAVAVDADHDLGLWTDLPAGVEVVSLSAKGGDAGRAAGRLIEALRVLDERNFDRVVGLAGDVLRLTPRIVATALSVVGGADLVIGPTRGGGVYLAGVHDVANADLLQISDERRWFTSDEVAARAGERRLVLRRLEPLSRLGEHDDLISVGREIARNPAATPRLRALLDEWAIPVELDAG